MGERFRLRRPTKGEAAAGLVAAAGAAWLASREPDPPSVTASDSSEQSPETKPSKARHTVRRQITSERQPMSEHEEYRQRMSDEVLEILSELDHNFGVTTTTEVNGQPVTDQFFGISYSLPDGRRVFLGTVYPDAATGQLQFDPDEEVRSWVRANIGSELNGLSTTDPEVLADAASDMLELSKLKERDNPVTPIGASDIRDVLEQNQTISTQETEEQREQADTGI